MVEISFLMSKTLFRTTSLFQFLLLRQCQILDDNPVRRRIADRDKYEELSL